MFVFGEKFQHAGIISWYGNVPSNTAGGGKCKHGCKYSFNLFCSLKRPSDHCICVTNGLAR